MIPAEARDILLYYGGALGVGLLIFMSVGRKRKGMRLKLKGSVHQRVSETPHEKVFNISGPQAQPQTLEKFSHIQPGGERPLNVVFNYNGHSWDAYEVLGLPAGSSPEKVDEAYRSSIKTVDAGSRSFLEAAYRAIQTEWKMFKAAK
ncbi:MAG: hypothetical protein ACXVA9_03130 [Bdellovibrionales bacterium]